MSDSDRQPMTPSIAGSPRPQHGPRTTCSPPACEPDALAVPDADWHKLTYRSARSRRLPVPDRPTFRGAEATIDITGPDKIARRIRVLYIHGSEEAGAARASRAKLLARAEVALARIARGLAAKPRQNLQAVERRVAQAVAKGCAGNWLRTEIHHDTDGKLGVRWWRDHDALADAERRDGLHALVGVSARAWCVRPSLVTSQRVSVDPFSSPEPSAMMISSEGP